MILNNQIHPSQDQIQYLIKNYPKDESLVMINILKFKEKSGNGEESGIEAYARYAKNVVPFLKKVGGKMLWHGNVNHTVIGDAEDQPHVVLLVQYPSVQKFLEMATDPEYIKVANDRTIALEYGGLMASSTVLSGF